MRARIFTLSTVWLLLPALTPATVGTPSSAVGERRVLRAEVCSFAVAPVATGEPDRWPGLDLAGAVVINEVLYDPAGPDQGREFVELMNVGHEPVSLNGWSLAAGDGARAGSWRTVWRGADGEAIAPGALFVIAERDVPGGDSRAELSLQNGPDGCALLYEEEAVDVVGWGALQFGEYCEGAPAPDTPSGESLSRMPDGHDTGNNSADFAFGRPPTPGRPNAPEIDMSFAEEGLEALPCNPAVDEEVRIRARIANTGFGAGRVDEFTLRLDVMDSATGTVAFHDEIESALSTGDTATIDAMWYPTREGLFELIGSLVAEGDGEGAGEVAGLAIRVGPGPLVVNEIMYDPVEGGEWIEIFNRSAFKCDLLGWRVRDRAGGTIEFSRSATVAPGAMVVAAQDSSGLVARAGGIDASSVVGSYRGRWMALNNSDGPDGLADVISLSDGADAPSDVASYSARYGGAGVSVERLRPDLIGRRPDNWATCVAAAGATPCAGNSAGAGAVAGAGLLSVAPAVVARGNGRPAIISYDLPFRPSELMLAIYSIDGMEVARLLDRRNGPSRGSVAWNGLGTGGAALPAGAYVILLTGTDGGGSRAEAKAVVALRRGD